MGTTKKYDAVIIGGGIAGAGLAALAPGAARTLLVEAESQPGYHSTGRSAAVFSRNLGCNIIRRLSADSEPYLRAPPADWVCGPVMSPMALLWIADDSGRDQLNAQLTEENMSAITAEQALAMFPLLRPGHVALAALESGAGALDVHRLHMAYLKSFRHRGGTVLTGARVDGLEHQADGWQIRAGAHRLVAQVVINAAGAWADRIAEMAGIGSLGIQPRRRTMAVLPLPDQTAGEPWPMVIDAGLSWYAKPEPGHLLVSPADEDPVPAQDIQPDDLVLAKGLDRFEQATTYPVRRVLRSWSGLRSFVADERPVVGFDSRAEGFFWLAGQGGVGIQTSPAVSRLAATLLAEREPRNETMIGDPIDAALVAALSPARFS